MEQIIEQITNKNYIKKYVILSFSYQGKEIVEILMRYKDLQ